MVTDITDKNFESDAMKATLPVLVDFWAPWCGPCRMIGPVVENLSKKFEGKMMFYRLNVDENPQTAGKYHIMSIPTLLFFKGGKVVETVVGAIPESALQSKINSVLS